MKRMLVMTVLMGAMFVGACNSTGPAADLERPEPEAVKSVMGRVADWQLANPSRHRLTDWTHGALFAGMAEWAQMADDEKYFEALKAFGEQTDWQLGRRRYHADDHAVGQMYIELYKHYGDAEMIEGVVEQFDKILADPSQVSLRIPEQRGRDRYWWCDALFMGPPTWAKLARVTGEKKYLEFMNREWLLAQDYLYDEDEQLFFRDESYFDRREANEEKIFWSRGNGWVFAGLVRVLEEMPENYPDRGKYETLYKEMAERLMAILPEDGLWHPSLLDPVTYAVPETSGSGFFVYGLAWGINHGYLDEDEALPVVLGAWDELVSRVGPDGKLGFVQPIGADPRHVMAEQTEIYGVGAFLLAGSEVYKIAARQGAEAMRLTAVNPMTKFREQETLSLAWDEIDGIDGITAENAAVFDFQMNALTATQAIDMDGDGETDELVFQLPFAPGERRYFWVMKRPAGLTEPEVVNRAYCRFVPERMDDFVWENDRMAARMYGKALEWETVSPGIDAWCKRVPYPIVNTMYKNEDYHHDHYGGADAYKVGPTLGCGGMAPFKGGKLLLSRNFRESNVITDGPIRAIFELTYEPWDAGGETVSEVKRIIVDTGTSMNRVESRLECDGSLPVAAGVVLRPEDKFTQANEAEQWLATWLPAMENPGDMGCAVVMAPDRKAEMVEAAGHLLAVTTVDCSKPFVYYMGSCWSEGPHFDTFEDWTAYLGDFAEGLRKPVLVYEDEHE